jgi:hypothetical protein
LQSASQAAKERICSYSTLISRHAIDMSIEIRDQVCSSFASLFVRQSPGQLTETRPKPIDHILEIQHGRLIELGCIGIAQTGPAHVSVHSVVYELANSGHKGRVGTKSI